jgi:hypothetical protein
MLQTSLSFKDASCAMASVGPRPNVARLVAAERAPSAVDQSSWAASARRSGSRSSASLTARSGAQLAVKLSKMATDATKVLVATTLNSSPAAIGSTMSQAEASGLRVSFTIAAVSAPKVFADDAASTRLRNREKELAFEPQALSIYGHDTWSDRGDRNAEVSARLDIFRSLQHARNCRERKLRRLGGWCVSQ